ncbi:endonuclease/exonuclease/phosphatase family protein [Actinomadura oligospora]|uniref:endonuclease/exonuclease/phosphatase family protein n=1 Tax=Actinomadura oligospora TaxID=111804 RepID=UPI0004B6BB14|nr:endonuclease/exonuclease/phosphatase family protein [Actinomadura oligospora]
MSETSGDDTTDRPAGQIPLPALTGEDDPSGRSAPATGGRKRRGRAWRSWVAWGGVAAWGTFALLRWVDGDRIPGLGVLTAPALAVTPYVAATAPIPVVAALVLRRPRAAIAAGLVTAGLAAAVLPRAIPGGQPAARGPELRVLTANLKFGSAAPDRVVDLVRRTDADVLSLQEYPPEAVAKFERAGLTGLLPYKVTDTRWGAAGSGLYSKYPLRALPSLPKTQMAMPSAEFTLPGGRRVQITAVHPVPPINAESLGDWKRDLGELPSGTSTAAASAGGAPADGVTRVLAGDFNATLDHATLRRLLGRGYADAAARTGKGLIPTWGVGQASPPLTIDHVLLDRRCAVRDVVVLDLPGSDHRAVYARLRLP